MLFEDSFPWAKRDNTMRCTRFYGGCYWERMEACDSGNEDVIVSCLLPSAPCRCGLRCLVPTFTFGTHHQVLPRNSRESPPQHDTPTGLLVSFQQRWGQLRFVAAMIDLW